MSPRRSALSLSTPSLTWQGYPWNELNKFVEESKDIAQSLAAK